MSDNKFKKGPHGAKNKPAFEEEIIESAVPSADERKTVILDEDLEGVEFEDRVWLYWTRNKKFIITTIAAAFAIVIGVQGWKMLVAHKKAQLASEYEAATTSEELSKFAKENSGSHLAGVAILQNADAQFASGNYGKAQKLYESTLTELSGTILFGRAKLGAGVSAYSAGDKAKGESILKSIFGDTKIAPAYRAQAGYLFGLAQKQDGKLAEAKAIFKQVSEEQGGGVFSRIAQETLSQME